MTVLLLKYNKVHDKSLEILHNHLKDNFNVILGTLPKTSQPIDLLSQNTINDYISSLNVNAIIMGDVFWTTGQRICSYCNSNEIKTLFLQHGQWIYIKNKKILKHYPTHTMAFGQNTVDMCKTWDYAKHSIFTVTGSPRYDSANEEHSEGIYCYFSPPVIEELIHNKPTGLVRKEFLLCLERLKGIDDVTPLVIQPHYREARVKWLYQMFPKAKFVDPKIDPFSFIRGAKKVIASRNSTVVLDAIAHKKITVLTDLKDNDICFFKRGYFGEFALESNNKDEFIRNITSDAKLDNVEKYVNKARKYIFLGNASERIERILMRYNIA